MWGSGIRDRNLSGTNYRTPMEGLSVSRIPLPHTTRAPFMCKSLLEFTVRLPARGLFGFSFAGVFDPLGDRTGQDQTHGLFKGYVQRSQ